MMTEWGCIDIKNKFVWLTGHGWSLTVVDRKVNKPRHSINNGYRKEVLIFNRIGVNIRKLF